MALGATTEIIGVLTVFGLSIVELWAAIPAGFAFNLNPAVTIAASSAGAILSAGIVAFAGASIRDRIMKWRYGEKREPKQGYVYRVWDKYGVIGLGFLSPLLFGAPIGAAIGSVLGANKSKLLLWMSIGIIVWSIALTVVAAAGLSGLKSLFFT